MKTDNTETKECGLEDENAGDIQSEHPLIERHWISKLHYEGWKQYTVPETGVKCDKCGKQADEVNLVGHCGECVNAKFNYG